jgi:hypothetical protein
MAIKWRTKILLAKIETSYGVDAAPTGVLNAILATDVTLTPMEGSDISRGLELPHLGAQATIPAELHQKLTFKVEMAASGTAGTAPAWGALLRGCAVAQVVSAGTSVTYNPVSEAHESLTLHLWIGDTRYVLKGARGTAKIMIGAQAIPYLEFSFTGLFSLPAETARVTPTLSGFQKPLLATSTNTPVFTLDATSFVLRSLALDLGNQIENRFLIGSESVLITEKAETIEAKVEAVALTTFNPFSKASTQASVALALTHGTVAGQRLALAVPTAQMQRPQGLENAQNILEWPLRLVPLPGAGNDQWTLTLT